MIRKYLYQRYPAERNKWNNVLPISIFVGLFMMVFQPFGLSELESEYKYLILAGYGIVTLIILVFNLFLLPAIFPEALSDEKWTVLKEILYLIWILFTVGLGNLLYSAWTMGFTLSFKNALFFQIYTLVIGTIPITVIIIIKQNYLKRKNEGNAEKISATLGNRTKRESTNQPVRITSENEKETVETTIHDLLYIKSEGNYITIVCLKEGKLNRALLRNTLKRVYVQLSPFASMYQCHRSWLINLERITKVTGNSQGLRIELEGTGDDIPVARNQIKEFKEKLAQSSS